MKKILLIDDNQIIISIYRNKLQAEGFEVEAETDGEMGLKTALRVKPDLLLLDLMLPKLSGIEVFKRLRAAPGFEHTPIIVLSNAPLSNTVIEAWRDGATQVLMKSTSTPALVLEKIREALTTAERSKASSTETLPAKSETSAINISGAEMTTPASVARAFDGSHINSVERQQTLRQAFLTAAPQTIEKLRSLVCDLLKSPGDRLMLTEIYCSVYTLAKSAHHFGLSAIFRMADALELLIKELREQPSRITPSSLRTLAQGVGTLFPLFKEGAHGDASNHQTHDEYVLVVDDEPLARRASSAGIEKAGFHSIRMADPKSALGLLMENQFDLILSDINMPGMNGFEFFEKLRNIPSHATTPVIFITSAIEFESQITSALKEGTDMIIKPFRPAELAVKAIALTLKCHAQIPAASLHALERKSA